MTPVDCAAFDELVLDLALGELDAEQDAAARVHAASCEACAKLLARLEGGARAANALDLVDPPSGLEAKIFAALAPPSESAGAASAPAPIKRKPRGASRWIAAAGAWAMRPPVAMAAAAILLVGMSATLLRRSADREAHVASVSGEGSSVSPPLESARDEKKPADPAAPPPGAIANVMGGDGDKAARAQGSAVAATDDDRAANAESKNAGLGKDKSLEAADGVDGKLALRDGPAEKGLKEAPAPTAAAPAAAAPRSDTAKVDTGGASAGPIGGLAAGGETTKTVTTTPAAPVGYDASLTAFKAGQYSSAARGFSDAAKSGDHPSSSWLYAGRSFRAAGSCVQAIPCFESVITSYAGSTDVPYAALEGGQCAKQLGDVAKARSLLTRATTYANVKAQADRELKDLDTSGSAGGAGAGAAAKPAPAKKSAPVVDESAK